MAVTEILRGIGSWSLQLREDTPKDVLDALQWFGHITINTGLVSVAVGDAMLPGSRYAGIYRGRGATSDQYSLVGPGMAAWLGDEDGKGEIFETAVVLNHDFEDAIPLLLPDSILPGTIYNINPGSPYVGQFQYVSPREAIDYLCQTVNAEWRVNNNGTLDAGLASQLFTVIPEAAIWRKGWGADMFLEAIRGQMATDIDMNDFTTRVVLLASGTEGSVVTATADINPGLNPYKDLHGNALKRTRIVSESDTDATNAPARAQLQLNRFSGPRKALTMSTGKYDMKGTAEVGDYIWAFDPEVGIYDLQNEVVFRGERFWPMAIRLVEMTWPVVEGMSVAYRDYNGKWLDLTPFIIFEKGETQLVVGGYNRSLGGDGGSGGSRPIPDTSVPAAPTWNPDEFLYSVYQSPLDGSTRAQVDLSWDQPLNQDSSIILDGDHYEIRWRTSVSPVFPSTHDQLSNYQHNQLIGMQDQPIQYAPTDVWKTAFAGFDEQRYLLTELQPSMPYEAQIRAVDAAKPPNTGLWSALTTFQTTQDTIPPATPAPPVVAANRMAIQVIHTLGRSDGGTFNLDLDLHHLEVHGGNLSTFVPTQETLIGKIIANVGMLKAKTPVVWSFNMDKITAVYFKVIAVDNAGNASLPSTSVSATAQLIDSAHISDLTASKITAGSITADLLVGAYIGTNVSPNERTLLGPFGLESWDRQGNNTVWIANDGRIFLRMYNDSSEFLIQDANGTPRLQASTAEVSIRDSFGNRVFSNQTANGWGVHEPAIAIPMNAYSEYSEYTFNSDYRTTFAVRIPVSHPKLYWAYTFQVLFGGAVGAAGLGWSFAKPTEFLPVSDGLIDATPNTSANDQLDREGIYTWPNGMYGQIVWLFLFQRMSTGGGSGGQVNIKPNYFFGRGY